MNGIDDNMEDLNEDEAIAAFLSRFGGLKSGGYYGNGVEGEDAENDIGIEVDATVGFVNRDLVQQEVEEEEEWWKENSHSQKLGKSGKASRDSDNGEWDDSSQEDSQGSAEDDGDESEEDPADDEDLSEEEEVERRTQATPKRSGRKAKRDNLAIDTKPSICYDKKEEKNTWLRKQAMASYGKGWEKHSSWLSPKASSKLIKPGPIDGVAAADNLGRFLIGKRLFPDARPWKLPYKERTKEHSGFFHVDVFSIYESSGVDYRRPDDMDMTPWEHRTVKQGFFHERSIAFSRNWFGELDRRRGNPKYRPPFCKPKSMEMPIENIPDPGEWTEEWYTTWKRPHERRGGASADNDDSSSEGSYTEQGSFTEEPESFDNRGSFITDASSAHPMSTFSGSHGESSDEDDDDDDMSWEEAPECGTIINVKQKIGERVSRVHPDYTSSLRRSRWRKKYFPRGTFPY